MPSSHYRDHGNCAGLERRAFGYYRHRVRNQGGRAKSGDVLVNVFSGGVNECGVEVAGVYVQRILDGLRLEKSLVCLLRPFFVLAWRAEPVTEIPKKHAPAIECPHRLFPR